MTVSSVSPEFFEAKYRNDADPWKFETSPYELSRYEEVIRALNHRRFQRAFEPGCSIGVLTERLASLCDRVIAIDISATAAKKAQARCAGYPGVTVRVGSLSKDVPSNTFDLIVLSEIGYYFEPQVLRRIATDLRARLDADGILLAEHWLGVSQDHLLSGDEVHDILNAVPGLAPTFSKRLEGFRIDIWRAA